MADVKSKENREHEWWAVWRAEDYSWDGLAEKRREGWSVAPDGAVVESGRAAGGWRPATLQDYWRDEQAHLIEGDGKRWTRAHCPFAWRDGTPTPKAGWGKGEKAALDALLSAKLGAAADTKFEREWYERMPVGADRRAQLQGAVLFGAPTHSEDVRSALSVRFDGAYFAERADFNRATFSGDADFDHVTFSKGARFSRATFSGDARFSRATFSEGARFGREAFSGDADFNLYQGIDQVLDDLRVPDSERSEVKQNLMEGIAADLIVRLGGRLSEDDKKQLAKIGEGGAPGQEPDLSTIAEFFRSKFSRDELIVALSEATESVLAEFVAAMESPDNEVNPAGVGSDSATINSEIASSGVSFDRATFSGTACFDRATFSGDTFFSRATFSGDARFDRAIFSGDARFDSATFERDATFGPDLGDTPTFKMKGEFGGARFRGASDFSRLKFQDDADFNRAIFAGPTFFEKTIFLQDTTFERASFADVASFAEADFSQSITFLFAYFERRANFSDTKFLQNGGKGKLDFIATHFADFALFKGAKFPRRCAQFSGAFEGAQFDGVAYFRDAGLHWIAAFHGASLGKNLILDPMPEGDKQFLSTVLPGTAKYVTEDVEAKVEQEQKERAKIANIQGSKIKPVTRKERRNWRRDLPEQRLRELEGGCRVVRLAMGRDRNEVLEQRYYRFQLMVRRHQKHAPGAEKFFSWMYWLSSKFGSALFFPLFTLVPIIWLLFATAYWGWSRALSGGGIAPLSAWIEGKMRFDPDYIEALRYSASRILPFGAFGDSSDQWTEGFLAHEGVTGLLIRALASLESLIAIVLAFLFVLAVRRRFQIS